MNNIEKLIEGLDTSSFTPEERLLLDIFNVSLDGIKDVNNLTPADHLLLGTRVDQILEDFNLGDQ